MSVNREAFQQFYGAVQHLGETAPQDELSDEERVRRAKAKMIEKIDARMATDLESCVHCGMCAEACPFYMTTHDGKYTPVHKLFLLRRVFRRELTLRSQPFDVSHLVRIPVPVWCNMRV